MLKNLLLVSLAVVLVMAGVYVPRLFSGNQDLLTSDRLVGTYDATHSVGLFHGRKVAVPGASKTVAVLSAASNINPADKRIEVDLTNQRVYAFEGDTKVFDFLVSTGRWGRTPTGTFTIWAKPKYTLMTGGSKALQTYYYLPNVPFVQFFYNNEISKLSGYSLHGTYWHSNFGHPMSHGCINMKTEEAEQLFYWTNPVFGESGWATYATASDPGTKVIIYGTAPAE